MFSGLGLVIKYNYSKIDMFTYQQASKRNLHAIQKGVVFSAYSLTAFVASPIAGYMVSVDRWSPSLARVLSHLNPHPLLNTPGQEAEPKGACFDRVPHRQLHMHPLWVIVIDHIKKIKVQF